MKYGINALKILNKKIIFLALGMIIFLNIIPFAVLGPILILLLAVMLGLVFIFIFAYDDFYFLFGFYLLGLTIRAFLSFLFYMASFFLKINYMPSPGFLFLNDGWCYSQQGWFIHKFAEKGINITMQSFLSDPNLTLFSMRWSGNVTQYDFFTAFIYSITGYSPLSLFFISALAGSMAGIFIYLMAKELFSKNVARVASLFAFFWPSFILWSTQHLKEPMIVMFVCILLWTIFYIYRSFVPGLLLLSIPSIWVLFKIGFPYLFIIISIFFFTGFFLFIRHLFKNRFVIMLLIGLFSLAGLFLFKDKVISYISETSAYDIKNYSSVFEFLNYSRNVRAVGRLSAFRGIDLSSFGKALIFSPLGFLYAIFAPFPWQLGSVSQIMAVPETILFYILFPFTLKGIVFGYRNRFNQSIILFLVIISVLFFLALVEGNIGTLFRHRAIAFYLLFIFTAIGISLKRRFGCSKQRL